MNIIIHQQNNTSFHFHSTDHFLNTVIQKCSPFGFHNNLSQMLIVDQFQKYWVGK